MHLGMVGLGKMGGNMVRRLRAARIDVVAHDIDDGQTRALCEETGASAAASLEALVQSLPAPRTVWLVNARRYLVVVVVVFVFLV